MDYSLCCQTVTLYRKQGDSITRQVLEGCYLAGQCSSPTESYGKSRLKKFLLIIPGDSGLEVVFTGGGFPIV